MSQITKQSGQKDYTALLEQAMSLVRRAKDFFFDQERAGHIHVKGKSDYVTDTDTSVQEFLKNGLQELDPSIQFLGEENGEVPIDFSGAVWILDPVDGTTNLIHDFRMSTISLALCVQKELELGIVYWPYMDELFYAEKNKGAFLNGAPISVSSVTRPEDSLIILGPTPYQKERYADMVMRISKRIFLQCQDVRLLGSAALDLAYIACGRADGYFEKVLKPWDYAAGALILQEAGGRILQWDQKPLQPDQVCSVLADNGKMGNWLFETLEPDL